MTDHARHASERPLEQVPSASTASVLPPRSTVSSSAGPSRRAGAGSPVRSATASESRSGADSTATASSSLISVVRTEEFESRGPATMTWRSLVPDLRRRKPPDDLEAGGHAEALERWHRQVLLTSSHLPFSRSSWNRLRQVNEQLLALPPEARMAAAYPHVDECIRLMGYDPKEVFGDARMVGGMLAFANTLMDVLNFSPNIALLGTSHRSHPVGLAGAGVALTASLAATAFGPMIQVYVQNPALQGAELLRGKGTPDRSPQLTGSEDRDGEKTQPLPIGRTFARFEETRGALSLSLASGAGREAIGGARQHHQEAVGAWHRKHAFNTAVIRGRVRQAGTAMARQATLALPQFYSATPFGLPPHALEKTCEGGKLAVGHSIVSMGIARAMQIAWAAPGDEESGARATMAAVMAHTHFGHYDAVRGAWRSAEKMRNMMFGDLLKVALEDATQAIASATGLKPSEVEALDAAGGFEAPPFASDGLSDAEKATLARYHALHDGDLVAGCGDAGQEIDRLTLLEALHAVGGEVGNVSGRGDLLRVPSAELMTDALGLPPQEHASHLQLTRAMVSRLGDEQLEQALALKAPQGLADVDLATLSDARLTRLLQFADRFAQILEKCPDQEFRDVLGLHPEADAGAAVNAGLSEAQAGQLAELRAKYERRDMARFQQIGRGEAMEWADLVARAGEPKTFMRTEAMKRLRDKRATSTMSHADWTTPFDELFLQMIEQSPGYHPLAEAGAPVHDAASQARSPERRQRLEEQREALLEVHERRRQESLTMFEHVLLHTLECQPDHGQASRAGRLQAARPGMPSRVLAKLAAMDPGQARALVERRRDLQFDAKVMKASWNLLGREASGFARKLFLEEQGWLANTRMVNKARNRIDGFTKPATLANYGRAWFLLFTGAALVYLVSTSLAFIRRLDPAKAACVVDKGLTPQARDFAVIAFGVSMGAFAFGVLGAAAQPFSAVVVSDKRRQFYEQGQNLKIAQGLVDFMFREVPNLVWHRNVHSASLADSKRLLEQSRSRLDELAAPRGAAA